MRVEVVTLFPELIEAFTACGIVRRAVERRLLRVRCWNPRDYTHDRHRTVDDRPYGGGPGMVMKVEPLRSAILAARRAAAERSAGDDATGEGAGDAESTPRVIYLSPQGRTLDQRGVETLAARSNLVLVAGRYEGIDERIVETLVDEEWSIGDYVLSGGEPGAMVMIDALTRLLPGALGAEESAQQDSFSDGLLDCPHYTRPETVEGRRVPSVLLGGNHAEIRRWRLQQSLGRTWERRPELLRRRGVSAEERRLLDEYCAERGVEPWCGERRDD